jgi:hypothetical protein
MPFGQRTNNRPQAEPPSHKTSRRSPALPFKSSTALYLVGCVFLVVFGSRAIHILQNLITVAVVENKFENAIEEKTRLQQPPLN